MLQRRIGTRSHLSNNRKFPFPTSVVQIEVFILRSDIFLGRSLANFFWKLSSFSKLCFEKILREENPKEWSAIYLS